ncbi:MAG: hypothetical protein LUH18_08690 [Oscillospiraceae bacterium]|nr:hypothetical protein [Oscillospiraceae bacterium]
MKNESIIAFEAIMKESPYSKFDSGYDGIIPECRTCRFNRPFWKDQSCVFQYCPYSPYELSRGQKDEESQEQQSV